MTDPGGSAGGPAFADAVLRVLRRRGPGVLRTLLIAILGAWLGAALAPATHTRIGPFETQVAVVASTRADVELLLPPAGEVSFDTHLAPFAVQIRIARVDLDAARRLISSPEQLRRLTDAAPDELRRATLRAAATTVGCALAGALVLSVLVHRRAYRRTAAVAGTVVAGLLLVAGVTKASFEADRLAQPRFTGLLSEAPYVARDASSMIARLESYRSGLSDILRSVTTLYATAGGLPVLPGGSASDDLITVLHVSDIHLNPLAFDLIDRLVRQFGVDVVIDTGDITTWGTEVETRTLSRIGTVGAPYVFVRGNHDSRLTQAAVLRRPNAYALDGQVVEVGGLVIAGIGDPRFTPDPQTPIVAPGESTATGPTVPGFPGVTSVTPSGDATPTGTAVPAAEVQDQLPPDNAAGAAPDPQTRAGARLAEVIRSWNATHPRGEQVKIAALHDPSGAAPLFGVTPLVLAGHTHKRDLREEGTTRMMIQGSTGGAGITARGLGRLADGEPLPLAATLIYLSRKGDDRGRLLAYDTVTVGGFGLASVSLERHVIRDAEPGEPAEPEPSRRPPSP